ncbi:hypothetical protein X777_14921 [Ooceraea biroi]|uniref:Uncharacterized protein n=1 Tax=Ooceraea biroi TaxID=2015173 RepID=A0A026WRV0_OOCBI|nr:hypothetical protein X777_14921 [Ooceraea biroi]
MNVWSSGYIHYKNVGLGQRFALLPTRRSFDFQEDRINGTRACASQARLWLQEEISQACCFLSEFVS